jgi:hypothetical protein
MKSRHEIQLMTDAFVRASLMRRKTEHSGTCKWCGQEGKWDYGWKDSQLSGRRNMAWTGPFCSVSCYRTYTGQGE